MSKLHKFSIIRKPIVTEKSTLLQEENRYVFEVAPSATKHEIKDAVQLAFGVSVEKVRTMNVKGKKKRFGPRYSQLRSWK